MKHLTWGLVIFLSAVFLVGSDVLTAKEEKTEAQESLERRQRVELLSYFLKDPDDAVVPTAPSAVLLFNQAVGYFQNNEYELARATLQESLALNDQNALAYELLGDIDYMEQKMSDAKENYQIAYNLQPSSVMKKKLEKIRKETSIERDLATYREKHFIIKYHDEVKAYEGFELRELLRDIYNQVSRDFAYYFKHKVVVLLYDFEDYKKISDAPHWIAGFYDGKVRMPINRQGYSDQEFRSLTTHEVTHAFIAAMSQNKAPVWIHEGLAQFEQDRVGKIDIGVFEKAVAKNSLIPLERLMDPKVLATIRNPAEISLFYQQSFHLVRYLVDRYRMFRVKNLLEEFGKGQDSVEAIRSVLRISIKHLEQEWRDTF